jgi:hypothetical protein
MVDTKPVSWEVSLPRSPVKPAVHLRLLSTPSIPPLSLSLLEETTIAAERRRDAQLEQTRFRAHLVVERAKRVAILNANKLKNQQARLRQGK